MVHLQNELAKRKGSMWINMTASDDYTRDLSSLLHQYADAIRDYAFFSGLQAITGSQAQEKRQDLTHAFPEIADLPGDPFNSASRRLPDQSLMPVDPLRKWLKARLPSRLAYTKREQLLRTDELLKGEPPEQVSTFLDKLALFMVTFAGGLSLGGPMLMMRIGENLTKSLVTTSVAVVLFAGITSLILRANNTDTVAATATYAAVLVVCWDEWKLESWVTLVRDFPF
ncbi:c0e3cb6f-56eb-401b-bcfe-d268996159bc [Sclerotinia trifoliorum]|uniref:C0e3cb6f-56eb-401b-bcfe-d268996159bc n=1 Tax=Sclerotinia trifoliorum TaxID=28548 RepID=A0A8H2W3T1_9HELO|nr:c0e3cb6f-56eb-401b-bcfe-d268996159bc [Sclerotinia trifoliorum]